MKFDVEYMMSLYPLLISAVKVTLYIALVSLIFTVILGSVISVIRFFKVKILNQILGIYISFFRATPLLAQLFFLSFGVPQIIPAFQNMSAVTATIVTLSLNMSAYMAENFRGALESVEEGQFEACSSVGMNSIQAMVRIIIPQAIRVAIPSIGNNFIMLIKSSSLGFTVGVIDVLAKAKIASATTFKFFEAYFAVMVVYWILVIIFEQIQKQIENKVCYKY